MSERDQNEPSLMALFGRLADAQDRALAAQDSALARVELGEPAAAALARQGTAGERRVRRTGQILGGLAAAAVVLGAVAMALAPRARPLTAQGGDRAGTLAPDTVVTAGDSELPLRFSDGSLAVFRPGSSGRLLALHGHGAEVELLAGTLEANIHHGGPGRAGESRWVFRAGPFAVRVTGTRFDVEWSPRTRRLVVALREGGVTVDGAVLGAGVPLRAGQRLSVALDERAVKTESLSAPTAAPAAAPAALPAPPAERAPAAAPPSRHTPTRTQDSWHHLAEQGAHAEAWAAAQRAGVAGLRRRLDAAGLLALADVARYAGAREESRSIFVALVERFPRHHLAGDAVFSLGRIAFEAGDGDGAAGWFARYQREWPRGPLLAEAVGRLLELARARGDHAGAEAAARAYLERAPSGPYAALARRTLAGTSPVDERR